MPKPLNIVTVHGYRYDFEAVLSAAKIALSAAINAVERGRPNLESFEETWRQKHQVADACNDQVTIRLPRLMIITRILGHNSLMLSATTGLFISDDGARDGSIDPMPGILIGASHEDPTVVSLTLTVEEATAIEKTVTALDLGVKVGIQAMIKDGGAPGTRHVTGHYVAIGFPRAVFASAVPEKFTMAWYGMVVGGTTPGKPPIEA
jgi:hypothetical protein